MYRRLANLGTRTHQELQFRGKMHCIRADEREESNDAGRNVAIATPVSYTLSPKGDRTFRMSILSHFTIRETATQLNNAISNQLNAIVLKMLEKNPDDRYQSLEEFITALDSQ